MHSEDKNGTIEKQMICHGDLKGVRLHHASPSLNKSIIQNNYLVELERDETAPSKTIVKGKITDFGLSTIMNANPSIANSQFSAAFRWRAPELKDIEDLHPEKRLSLLEKADIWSFAITSLEVVEDKMPFASIRSDSKFYGSWVLKPSELIEHLPRECPERLLSRVAFDIMKWCWNVEPSERPRMDDARAAYYRDVSLERTRR